MKNRALIALTAVGAGALVLAMGPRIFGAETDIVLAPVRANQSLTMNALLGFINSEPVFVNDMLRPVDDQLRNLAKTSHNLSEFKTGARTIIEAQMKTYVSTILVNASAKAALTDEDKQKLEFFINKQRIDLLAKWGGSQALADQALKAQGSSVEKELLDQRRTLIVRLYLSKQILPKIVVTRQMVMDEYKRAPKRWQQEATVELYTITLPVSRFLPRDPGVDGAIGPVSKNITPEQIQDAKRQAMNEAKDITEKLKKGADFAQMAQDKNSVDGRKSKGGRTPDVKRGSLVNSKEEDYIFSLPAHTLGSPLLLDDADPMKASVVVIKVGDRTQPRTIPFSEAQEEIRTKLHSDQYDQLRMEYMQNLYKGAAIERVDRMTDTAVDVAVSRYATQ